MHEVRCRVESALRTFWDMRKIWRDSSMSRGDKLRLYKAAVVSTATYGCEAWRLTEQVVKHLRYMNGKCLAQIFEMEVQDCIAKPPWDLVGSVRLRRINWLGGVLRRPDTDIVKRVVVGADCQFDRYIDGAKEFNDVAYPLVADPYEESATADIRNATIPSLETVLASGLCPDGETRFRSPRDCVIWGDTSKWANLRLVAADKIKTTARTINFDPAGL
jgi:hypothetical protein